jgi:hypothetical protein
VAGARSHVQGEERDHVTGQHEAGGHRLLHGVHPGGAGAATVLLLPHIAGVLRDGNKSLYLVFVGVVFSQYLGLLLEQLGQQLGLFLEQLGQQHLGCFFRTAGQQHLDCF